MDVGFTQGLKNKLAEAIALGDWERGKSLVSTTYFMMLIIFLPVCLILEFVAPYINWSELLNIDAIYQDDIVSTIGVLLVFFCIQMFVNVIVSVAAAFQRVALSNSFNVIGNVLSLLTIWILTKTAEPSLVYLCFAISAMPIFVAIIGSIILYRSKFITIKPSIKYIRLNLCRDLFNLGYKFFIINIQVVVLYQSTNILISNISTPLMVTSYNIAYKYLNVAMMLFSIILSPLWPAFTDAYTRKDFDWMIRIKRKMDRLLMLSIVVCILLAIISPWVYKIWIGDRAEIPSLMTWAVTLYVIVFCWCNLNGTIIAGIGKLKLLTRICLIGLFFHVPLSLFLGKFMGAYGVLASLILINVIYAIFQNVQSYKILYNKANGIWNK